MSRLRSGINQHEQESLIIDAASVSSRGIDRHLLSCQAPPHYRRKPPVHRFHQQPRQMHTHKVRAKGFSCNPANFDPFACFLFCTATALCKYRGLSAPVYVDRFGFGSATCSYSHRMILKPHQNEDGDRHRMII